VIEKELLLRKIADYRVYSLGMQRASLHQVAGDYEEASNFIEELLALCDEKDATIDELRNQLEHDAKETSITSTFLGLDPKVEYDCVFIDGRSVLYPKSSRIEASEDGSQSLDHPHAPVNDGVVRGPVTFEELEDCYYQLIRLSTIYPLDAKNVLERFARSRGVL
jgi:hypothetical protein